jgi:hypothetical protein
MNIGRIVREVEVLPAADPDPGEERAPVSEPSPARQPEPVPEPTGQPA